MPREFEFSLSELLDLLISLDIVEGSASWKMDICGPVFAAVFLAFVRLVAERDEREFTGSS
jgi:hypothetical protein